MNTKAKPQLRKLAEILDQTPIVVMVGCGRVRFVSIIEKNGRIEATSESGGIFYFPRTQELWLADIPLNPAQATAQKLVEQWEERRLGMLERSEEYDWVEAAKIQRECEGISMCRRELQAAFGLGSLGSAPQPPSDSES